MFFIFCTHRIILTIQLPESWKQSVAFRFWFFKRFSWIILQTTLIWTMVKNYSGVLKMLCVCVCVCLTCDFYFMFFLPVKHEDVCHCVCGLVCLFLCFCIRSFQFRNWAVLQVAHIQCFSCLWIVIEHLLNWEYCSKVVIVQHINHSSNSISTWVFSLFCPCSS